MYPNRIQDLVGLRTRPSLQRIPTAQRGPETTQLNPNDAGLLWAYSRWVAVSGGPDEEAGSIRHWPTCMGKSRSVASGALWGRTRGASECNLDTPSAGFGLFSSGIVSMTPFPSSATLHILTRRADSHRATSRLARLAGLATESARDWVHATRAQRQDREDHAACSIPESLLVPVRKRRVSLSGPARQDLRTLLV